MDQYAQGLRRLFQRAYPQTQQGSKEAEEMGGSVLAFQFIAGLKQELKKGVASSDQQSSLEQLLVKGRIEEAKLRDLKGSEQSSTSKCESNKPSVNQSRREYRSGKPPSNNMQPLLGPKARDCWWRNRSEEARRRPHVSAFTAENDQGGTRKRERDQEPNQSKVHELRRQLQQVEVEEVIAEVTATLRQQLESPAWAQALLPNWNGRDPQFTPF